MGVPDYCNGVYELEGLLGDSKNDGEEDKPTKLELVVMKREETDPFLKLYELLG